MDKDMYDKGLAIRSAVLGKDYVDNAIKTADDFNRPLQELVTELYLSEGRKRKQNWKHVATHLGKMGVKQKTIDHLLEQDNPELVANLIKTLDK